MKFASCASADDALNNDRWTWENLKNLVGGAR